MKMLCMILVAGGFLTAVDSSAQAQQGQLMRRTTVSGQPMILKLPKNRAECLANRRALGFDIKTQGAGRCDRFFPRK